MAEGQRSRTFMFREVIDQETEGGQAQQPQRQRPVAVVRPQIRQVPLEIEAQRFEPESPPRPGQPRSAFDNRPIAIVNPRPRPQDDRLRRFVNEVDHVREDLRQVRERVLGAGQLPRAGRAPAGVPAARSRSPSPVDFDMHMGITPDTTPSWGEDPDSQHTPDDWPSAASTPSDWASYHTPDQSSQLSYAGTPSSRGTPVSWGTPDAWGTPVGSAQGSSPGTPESWNTAASSPGEARALSPPRLRRPQRPYQPQSPDRARRNLFDDSPPRRLETPPNSPASWGVPNAWGSPAGSMSPFTPDSWNSLASSPGEARAYSPPRGRRPPRLYQAQSPGQARRNLFADDSSPGSSPENLEARVLNLTMRLDRLEQAVTPDNSFGEDDPVPQGLRERLVQSQERVQRGIRRLQNIIDRERGRRTI